MILFVDLETSDLLKRHLPLSDPLQPWAVSMAAELCTLDGKTLDFFFTRIRADGRKVRPGAEAVHGISSSMASRSGVSEVVALGMLCGFASQAKYVVGHGITFDQKVVEGLMIRKERDTRLWIRPGLEFRDTMEVATPVCRLPHKTPSDSGGFKYPSLDEAGQIVCGMERRDGRHTGWDDLQRTKALYFELERRGCVEPIRDIEIAAHASIMESAIEAEVNAKRGRLDNQRAALDVDEVAKVHAKAALTQIASRSPKVTKQNIIRFCDRVTELMEAVAA